MSADVRENRIRRMADRQRLTLRKSRRRDPRAYDYGRYWLVDPILDRVVYGAGPGETLDQVEAYLEGRLKF